MDACLLFATELYALPILRPLAAAAQREGQRVGWVVPESVARYLHQGETRLRSSRAVRALAPRAVFCASNWVPPAFPGAKVQVFHGFNAEKREPDRGHFRLRGFFDLYCTQGPATTAPFEALAREHRYFAVAETGWPKLDPLFAPPLDASSLRPADGKPVAMYAATFTESLSSARATLDVLRTLTARGDRHWLLTLHPKCEPELIARYRALEGPFARFFESDRLLDMLRAADVLVCDTSSVIDEFAVQLKPVVTLRNRRPKPFMLDVAEPAQVDAAIDTALSHPPALVQALADHAAAIHPYRDGRSSERVLAATDRLLAGGYGPLARKPLNLWRRWQASRDVRLLLPD
ncbi:CDP-glycerol glycerophosphotransferase family protein [Frateuria terrea]|uniref:CDP-glycerol glycerophosphotransferase, TagB/SpsB family n=1 Tax=Frateuria terrea TaxID=529704 RepID=A0A1H6SJK8_9GAMM|nr:CDP-glycerol glycerophosphotransferase family protein [Frateuria terrea]SEI67096.1 CDP-glycerol glycerophosphotransferase, TagB/SpsB family [Frateuria terrea]SFP26371.1 CDP-glycerol glycerophosphotransferase, TagB/SpsB family [Frateuria terrea]